MIPDNVTLVVKAPNQQIDDQNVECQSSWTVRQLKGHLAEVYPSKPRTDEQKIIYSGKLLDDTLVLKDILRTYESETIHTMHLVCTPKRKMADTVNVKPTQSTDGLRQRNVPSTVNAATETDQPVETPRPETRQNDQNHSVEMQNYLSSYMNNYGRVPPYPNYNIPNYNIPNMGEGYLTMPNDPAAMANHMMMMQQAYLQYMQQYANMWQAGAVPTPTPPPQPPAPPAPPAEEEVQRDWLEHLYAASRLALLCSLIYLYGSPMRLLLVLVLAAAGYLHQIGFFRDLQLNPHPEMLQNANVNNAEANLLDGNVGINAGNANIANQNANVENVNANIENVNANIENVNANIENVNANIDNVNANIENVNANIGNAVNGVAVNENQQSLLAVTWMIFTTFFASLIPDNQ